MQHRTNMMRLACVLTTIAVASCQDTGTSDKADKEAVGRDPEAADAALMSPDETEASGSLDAGDEVIPAHTGGSSPAAKTVVDWDEATSLGFSAAEVAAVFTGDYASILRYVNGDETELIVGILATEGQLAGELGFNPNGPEPLAALAQYTGPGASVGEMALVVNVDVTFETADGRFSEHLNFNLQAPSLEGGWLHVGVAPGDLEGGYPLDAGSVAGSIVMNISLGSDQSTTGSLFDGALEVELPDGGWTDGKLGEW